MVQLGSRRVLGVPGGAYRGRVWRFALSRRWWIRHVLVVTFCAVFVRLGRWQWDRAQSPTGDWQNLGYSLQWPLFAVVLIAAWVRFLWLEQHRGPEAESPEAETLEAPPPVPRRPAYPPIREDDNLHPLLVIVAMVLLATIVQAVTRQLFLVRSGQVGQDILFE
ncbi:MAG: hypothetical protein ACJ72I_10585, partial [Pseudonocardiaceae bacterium]